jgi:Fe-S-cluster containining protein
VADLRPKALVRASTSEPVSDERDAAAGADHTPPERAQRGERGERDEDGRRIEIHPGCEAIVEFDPGRTFDCVDSCTWCCHHGVMLYEPDFVELAEHADLSEATRSRRGRQFVPREGKDRTDHVAADGGACRFLGEDGLCGLHAEADWKPTRCSVFPLEVSVENEEIHVSIREDAETHCEGMDVSERRLIDHLDAFLPETLWELPDPETKVEL